MADVTNISGRINSISQEGVAVVASQTLDERKNKKQSVVNQETDEELANHGQRIGTLEEAVGEGGSVDERIAQAKSEAESDIKGGASEDYDTLKKAEDAIKAEVNAREGAVSDEASARQDAINAAKTEIIGGASTDCNTLGKAEIKISTNAQDIAQLQAAYEALTQSTPVIVEPTDIWPVATPEEDVIYRVIDRVNTPPQKYSDYMYNGTAMVLMATYDNAIDDIPTPGSNNLVKSGGVASHIVYDISEANAIGSTLATYADLAAALGNNGANIPPSIQKGGMSVKFIQSSDNKYVQYRLMADSFSTTVANWQGVDDVPTAGSNNLVKSGGVAVFVSDSKQIYPFATEPDDSKLKALLTIQFSECPYEKVYLRQIYRNANFGGANNTHGIQVSLPDGSRIFIFNVNSSSYTENLPSDVIYFSVSGLSGCFKIDWSLLDNGDKIVSSQNDGKGVVFDSFVYPTKTILDKTLSRQGIAPDSKKTGDAIKFNAYPINITNGCPIKNIVLSKYGSRSLKLLRIGRKYVSGGNTIHLIQFQENDSTTVNFLNILSSQYIENSIVNFSVNGYEGFLVIDWSEIAEGTSVGYNNDVSQIVFDSCDNNCGSTYPFAIINDTPIVDIRFTSYDKNKRYFLKRVYRNAQAGSDVVHAVVLSDGTDDYNIFNMLSSFYTEKEENDFNVGGISGTFYIDWSKIANGTNKLYYRCFSDYCYIVSDIRNENNIRFGGNFEFVIPDVVYGVVGHPFAIFYYNIIKTDSLDGYHIWIDGTNSEVQNYGDRIHFKCQTSGTHTVRFKIRKNDTTNILQKQINVIINSENVPTIKALFIGDSFVNVGKMQAELKHLMGNSLTFSGTRSSETTDSTGTLRTILGEGRSGWSWKDYCTAVSKGGVSNAFWNPNANKFDYSYYVNNVNTDAANVTDVFLMSGPNDNSVSSDNYRAYYQEIVNSIKAYNGSVRIHCMMPLTCNCTGYGWGIRNYNGSNEFRYNMIRFGKDIIELFSNFSQCFVIPTHVNIDKDYDFPITEVNATDRNPTQVTVYNDNVHPNQYGYYGMSDVIFGHIVENCQVN